MCHLDEFPWSRCWGTSALTSGDENDLYSVSLPEVIDDDAFVTSEWEVVSAHVRVQVWVLLMTSCC